MASTSLLGTVTAEVSTRTNPPASDTRAGTSQHILRKPTASAYIPAKIGTAAEVAIQISDRMFSRLPMGAQCSRQTVASCGATLSWSNISFYQNDQKRKIRSVYAHLPNRKQALVRVGNSVQQPQRTRGWEAELDFTDGFASGTMPAHAIFLGVV